MGLPPGARRWGWSPLVGRDVGAMVLLESAFTFIGIGGSTEWGVLLASGRDYVIGVGGNPLTYWWTFLPATLALVFFGVGWSMLGDGLNTLLDPRQTQRVNAKAKRR